MKLVTRSQLGWPASAAPDQATTKGVKVHYEGAPVSTRLLTDHGACIAEWQAIRASHLANTAEGYSDIAYNYGACPCGYLLEGRGIGKRTGANGNQTLNIAHYAIVGLLGNSGLTEPTDAMLSAIRDGIDLLRQHGAGPEIKGHRDGYATACLPLDSTEVLTRAGWTPLGDVTAEHDVASWAMDSGILGFGKPSGIVVPYEADTLTIAGFETTPDHNWVTYGQRAWAVGCTCGFEGEPASIRSHVREGRRRGGRHETVREKRWKLMRADELGQDFAFPRAVHSGGPGLPLSDEQVRLLVWLQGDGHFMTEKRGPAPTLIGVEWHLRKARKIERLSALLDALDLPWRRNERADGTVSLRVYGEIAREQIVSLLPDKRFHWGLLDLSPHQAELFLDELMHVDGCAAGNYYSSAETVNLDVVQAVASINGRAAVRDGRIVRLRGGRQQSRWRGLTNKPTPGRRTLVGCLTTVDGTLIIRQSGQVAVMGNCPGEPLYAWVQKGAPRPATTTTTPAPAPEDPMDFTSLACTKPLPIQAGTSSKLYWDAEYQDGSGDHVQGGKVILSGEHYTGTVSVSFEQEVPDGVFLRLVQEFEDLSGTSGEPADELAEGTRMHNVSVTGRVPEDRGMTFEIKNDSDQPIKLTWAGLRLLTWPL